MSRVHVEPLSHPWTCTDPFLFCVHHQDAYPRANEAFGPDASLAGRRLGQDFDGVQGWNMYHGRRVPGFPPHPHRGFETVTVMRRGYVDHSDSLGAAARFGPGDVQWLTAGRGIVHSEMFPLLDRQGDNPLELFQIWLNLAPDDKMVDPHFLMLWGEALPRATVRDEEGRATEVTVVAGALGDLRPQPPPPRSWATRPDSHVALWTLVLEPGARFVLPEVPDGVRRTLHLFRGAGLELGSTRAPVRSTIFAGDPGPLELRNGPETSELLVLQGRPIGRPVVQYGPFVMNSKSEIAAAFQDYQATRFGGWPWPSDETVHPRDAGRFARYPDGSRSVPPTAP